jgi:hypothetical protein
LDNSLAYFVLSDKIIRIINVTRASSAGGRKMSTQVYAFWAVGGFWLSACMCVCMRCGVKRCLYTSVYFLGGIVFWLTACECVCGAESKDVYTIVYAFGR